MCFECLPACQPASQPANGPAKRRKPRDTRHSNRPADMMQNVGRLLCRRARAGRSLLSRHKMRFANMPKTLSLSRSFSSRPHTFPAEAGQSESRASTFSASCPPLFCILFSASRFLPLCSHPAYNSSWKEKRRRKPIETTERFFSQDTNALVVFLSFDTSMQIQSSQCITVQIKRQRDRLPEEVLPN